MLALTTFLACVLYLAPLVALVALSRRASDGPLHLAFAIPVALATDLLATFALCYLYPVEKAAFVRTLVLGLAVVSRVLHLPPVRRIDHRIDWPGALALVVALVPLLVVAEQGRSWGWTSPRAVTAYVVGGVGLVAFWLCERRAGSDAILPLRLFRLRSKR